MNTIAIFTRMVFDEKISDLRIKLYNEIYLYSLKNQSYKQFDIFVITESHKNCHFIWNKKGSSKNTELIKKQDTSGLNIEYLTTEELPKYKYHMQIRLDCDDYLLPNFISMCINEYNKQNKDSIITFNPFVYDYNKRIMYKRNSYSTNCPSMFSCMCFKNKVNDFIFNAKSHTALHRKIPNVILIDGFCVLVSHNENKVTNIRDTDKLLYKGDLGIVNDI